MNNFSEVKYAGFWARFLAVILDSIIVGIPVGLLVWLIGISDNQGFLNWLIFMLITVFLWAHWDGRTPGKKLMGIKIVTYPMLNPITHGKSFLRYIIGYTVSSLILGLGFIMVAFRVDKRGLHDLISGTCVIHEK